MKPLVIRASAGTGKTYRLSLEYINLLLTWRVEFDEILVITFTKKATAEIRQRIFEHLHNIVHDTAEGRTIKTLLQQQINPQLKLDDEAMEFLRATYRRMLTHKSDVTISTIDSFVNRIFSGIIAPYHNLGQFSIDNSINDDYLPQLYEHILAPENRVLYEDIFHTAGKRNLQSFDALLKNIIDQRWVFEFVDPAAMAPQDLEQQIELAQQRYGMRVNDLTFALAAALNSYAAKKGEQPWSVVIQQDYLALLASELDGYSLSDPAVAKILSSFFTAESSIDANYALFLSTKNPWNGVRIRNKELKDLMAEVRTALGDYLYLSRALIEQAQLISLAAVCLQKYDEIKFRDRIFTHSDISYYTFRFLYDPQLTVVEQHNVLNLFYEQLSYNTRFILIDEFQDTSILQWSIFKPLIEETLSGAGQKEYGSLIVVGDEKQAIYGWRGGERRLLASFDSLLSSPVEQQMLSTSYRSKPLMMNWLNELFAAPLLAVDPHWNYTPVDCARPDGGAVEVQLINRAAEDDHPKRSASEVYREFVRTTLVPALDAGSINPADTAILMRRNKDLSEMAAVLEECGVAYALQSSGSLFTHPAVQAALDLLRFVCYQDPLRLIAFLRSDAVLMGTDELKPLLHAWKNRTSFHRFLQQLTSLPGLDTIQSLFTPNRPSILLRNIFASCNFPASYPGENNLLNMQRLVEVAVEFEQTPHPQSLAGFLEYIVALEGREEYSQVGQSQSDAITLLTVHKSKGLQFETVCAFFDLSAHNGGSHSGLQLYYQFTDDFLQLQDWALTLNYNAILKNSRKSALLDAVAQREEGEELNNIYVALTRAKSNLLLCLHYSKKGGMDALVKKVDDASPLLQRFAASVWMQNNFTDIRDDLQQFRLGTIDCEHPLADDQPQINADFTDLLDITDYTHAQPIEPENPQAMAYEFLHNKSVLIGNIAHEFLSQVYTADASSLQKARTHTLALYGTLLPADEMQHLLTQIATIPALHEQLFAAEQWDQIFTEHTVFDADGREYRIDRLQISHARREILIVDYKTGSTHDEAQLQKYEEIIGSIPAAHGYRVHSQFIEINISLIRKESK
jgi:ATP-dependent exoDNAse (exonuclease V) beta subunit